MVEAFIRKLLRLKAHHVTEVLLDKKGVVATGKARARTKRDSSPAARDQNDSQF